MQVSTPNPARLGESNRKPTPGTQLRPEASHLKESCAPVSPAAPACRDWDPPAADGWLLREGELKLINYY